MDTTAHLSQVGPRRALCIRGPIVSSQPPFAEAALLGCYSGGNWEMELHAQGHSAREGQTENYSPGSVTLGLQA